MGKTIKQWENEIKKMDKNSLELLNKSFVIIQTWKFFNNEYEWTQYGVISNMIKNELKARC